MSEHPSHAEATLRCDCGCAILVMDYWKPTDYDPSEEGWFDIYTSVAHGSSFRYRMKVAWRVLRGKDPWVDALVFGPKQVADFRRFLDECQHREVQKAPVVPSKTTAFYEGQAVDTRYGGNAA